MVQYIVSCCLKARISEAEQTSIASQRFDNTHPRQTNKRGIAISRQRFHNIRGNQYRRDNQLLFNSSVSTYPRQRRMNYSRGCSLFSWPRGYKREATDSAVQLMPVHEKDSTESGVPKTEVKIHLPGRAVQNTEIRR
jgi:hypothetical protein